MPIYMKVPYASGSVTATKYQGWVELDSLQLGVERSVSMEGGSLVGRASGVPRFSQFTVTKLMDESSPGIIDALLNNKTGQKIEIAVVEAGDAPKEVVKYTLIDALVSSYNVSANAANPHESLGFSYSSIEMGFTPRGKVNTGTAPVRVSYDLKAGS